MVCRTAAYTLTFGRTNPPHCKHETSVLAEPTHRAGAADVAAAPHPIHGLAMCHTPPTPSPVVSPALVSLIHKYSGWPL